MTSIIPIFHVVIIVVTVPRGAVVAATTLVRNPHPPFVIRVIARAPMTMAMTVSVVADRPMAVYPGLD